MVTIETPGKSHFDIAKAAIDVGASIIQYRDKYASSRKLFADAFELRRLTRDAGALLIINDRVDIALAVEADGVHLGQDDLSLGEARRIVGDIYIIGISATCIDEAVEAAEQGADYIGLGPIFPTPSKNDAAPPMGLDGLVEIRETVDVPIVAIGGITIDNIEEVVRAGADGIAVISAVASAPDMTSAARTITDMIQNARTQAGAR